jgi:phage terminase large subunit
MKLAKLLVKFSLVVTSCLLVMGVDAAASVVQAWRENPKSFFYDELKMEPEPWLDEFLAVLPSQDPKEKQIALKACTGAGKSGALAGANLWFVGTHGGRDATEHPIGIVTSIDSSNLKSGLWKEIAVWRSRSEYLKRAFELTSTRLFAKHAPESWYVETRGWAKRADPEAQGRAMSGIHGKRVMATLDESGDIPVPLLRVAKQILSSTHEWGKILVGGNPTSRNGVLCYVCIEDATSTYVITITADPKSPKRGRRTDIENAKKMIAQYGRENPWVKSTILGEFPEASIASLLGPDEVEAAMNREIEPSSYEWSQKRLGVDVSRFGDDPTILFPRQGLRAFPVPADAVMRHARGAPVSVNIANRVLLAKKRWNYEICFLDATGGWAAGTRDILISTPNSGTIMNIQYAAPAPDSRYYNMRAYMWWNGAEWVKGGGQLPRIPELIGELTIPTYSFMGGKLLIEPKELVKKRLGRSPNFADALFQTFAMPDMPGEMERQLRGGNTHQAKTDWDPYAENPGGQQFAKTDDGYGGGF